MHYQISANVEFGNTYCFAGGILTGRGGGGTSGIAGFLFRLAMTFFGSFSVCPNPE